MTNKATYFTFASVSFVVAKNDFHHNKFNNITLPRDHIFRFGAR